VDPTHLPSLRDTLLKALQVYHKGPRTITTQLSLSIAGLALQFSQWNNPVQDMISTFGQNPETVSILLQFFAILPEELNNTRIPITVRRPSGAHRAHQLIFMNQDSDWDARYRSLLGENAQILLDLLAMYIQANGTPPLFKFWRGY
jgi:transportin-3